MNYRRKIISLLLCVPLLLSLVAWKGQTAGKEEQELPQVLRVASASDPKLDQEPQTLIFDSLVIFNEDREIVPSLARTWEANEDYTEFRFELAEGVKFSDGTELTEADYEKSLQDLAKAAYAGYINSLEDLSFVDGTLVFRFSEPQLYLLQDLAKVPIAKASEIDDEGKIQEFIGTGPYMIKDYEAEVETVLVTNPNYWNSDRNHKIEEIVWKYIPDPDARKLALESDLVDIIGIGEHYPSIPRESLAAFREDGEFAILDANPEHFTIVSGFMMNWKDGPLADIELRRALEYAVDRQVLVDTLYFGEARPSGRCFNPFFLDGPNEDEVYSYDLDKSRQILADAGYVLENDVLTKDGEAVVLRLITVSRPGLIDLASMVQSSFKELGIELKIETHEGALIKDVLTAGDYDINATIHGLFEPLMSSIHFNGIGTEHGPMGLGFGASQEIIAAAEGLLGAKNEEDISKFAKEYWTAQYEACAYLPLYTMVRGAVYNKSFTGFKFSADVFLVDLSEVERIAE